MKRIAIIVLTASVVLTFLFLGIWFAGLVVGHTLGGLIHVVFLLSIVTGLGVFVGIVLLAVSVVQKK